MHAVLHINVTKENNSWHIEHALVQQLRYIKGKTICYLCDLEQLLTNFFFPNFTFFSNSGELLRRV
jgi:hypothetical protein